jgi:hypothetical protein
MEGNGNHARLEPSAWPDNALTIANLGHAAVLAVAERPDQGDDVEAELVPRRHERALGLRPVGPAVARGGMAPGPRAGVCTGADSAPTAGY